jgi:hypothetical protein
MSRRPFHSSDFIGSAGPGLRKLRAAGVRGESWADQPRKMVEKLATTREIIREFMRQERWREAILAASALPADAFGDNAATIHRGREAILRPDFQRQLRRDPDQMIEEAKRALTKELPL